MKVKPDKDILSNKPFILRSKEENEIWQVINTIQELNAKDEYYVVIENLTEHPIGFTEDLPIAKAILDCKPISCHSIVFPDHIESTPSKINDFTYS